LPERNSSLQSLFQRYGRPIIVLSLLKRVEKQPRETLLGKEFENAINHINRKVGPADYKQSFV
jgi:hypothetical protein